MLDALLLVQENNFMGNIKEKHKEEAPKRMHFATVELMKRGVQVVQVNPEKIEFDFKGEKVSFWPYTGWASGKSIEDGRGIKKLLKQLDNNS